MKHKAYQLVDFNNPISVEYYKRSAKSFEPLSDVLDIEPVQCFVPETIPDSFDLVGGSKPHNPRSPQEIACFASHTNLISRLAKGEKFIIMEHDAFLIPGKEELLRLFLEEINKFIFFVPGISAEFYTVTQEVAQRYMNNNSYKISQSGAFSWLEYIVRNMQEKKDNCFLSMFPLCSSLEPNIVSISYNLQSRLRKQNYEYVEMDAPVTQLYILKYGNTIYKHLFAKKTIPSPKEDPNFIKHRNFYFMEE